MAQPLTVLTIDNEEIIRESIKAYLEDADYTVITADSGESGIAAFQKERPDLVLTDLRMGEVDGLEVVDFIHKEDPDIPVIVISGTGNISDAVQAHKSGAWDYVLKPVEDMAIISKSIDNVLERARLIKENRDYQHNLEKEVEKRTRELKSANEELAGINQRLKKIVKTSRGLGFCTGLESLGHKLLEEFKEHMLATGGSLYLIEESGLRQLKNVKNDQAPRFITFPLQEGTVFKRVLETKKSLLIPNIDEDGSLVKSGWNGYKNGTLLAFPLPDEKGGVIGILTMHSKRKPPFIEQDKEIGEILAAQSSEALRAVRATQTLKASEERFRNLTQLLPEAVMEVDTGGRLLYANKRAFDLFGYEKSSGIPEVNIVDVIAPEERDVALSRFQDRLAGNDSGANEYTALRPDGNRFPVIIHSNVIKKEDGQINVLAIAIDISEQKESQEKLKSSLHEKDVLLKEVHHRVKNNMQVIISLLNLQISRCESKVAYVLKDVVGRIRIFSDIHTSLYQHDSVSRLDFIEHLQLDFAHLKKMYGGNSDNYSLKVQMPANYLDVSTGVTCGLLMHELMTNSFKHAFVKQGAVRIIIERDDNGDIIKINYRDDGQKIGVYREGFGSVIINAMAAQLDLKMTINEKSQEKFVFQHTKKGADKIKKAGKIIFVEDEVLIAMSRIKGLKKLGFNVDENVISSGEDALAYFKKQQGDIVMAIMDITLEGALDGIQTVLEMKKQAPDMPVLFISGYEDKKTSKKISEIPHASFIKKTCSFAELSNQIQELGIYPET